MMELGNFIIGVTALVISIVAVLIAVPPFLQMICGRPKIRVAFNLSAEQGAQLLLCNIIDLPVTNWFLIKIGVTRNHADVLAQFDVREHGTTRPCGQTGPGARAAGAAWAARHPPGHGGDELLG